MQPIGSVSKKTNPAAEAAGWFLVATLFARLFAAAFAGQRLFHAPFFARLQVKRVPFYLFNNVFLLHFALKAAKRVFQRLALLHSNFSQALTPPNLSR
jgi:hypothetical protein